MMKGWQLRFFVLDEHTLCLNYYTSKEKVRKDIKRGKIFLKGAIIGKWVSPIFVLAIVFLQNVAQYSTVSIAVFQCTDQIF